MSSVSVRRGRQLLGVSEVITAELRFQIESVEVVRIQIGSITVLIVEHGTNAVVR
jgi:hypothetical protein